MESFPNVVLFGNVGAGKTTIINKLTGSTFKATRGGFSCTRQIQQRTCEFHPYNIYDLPGTEPAEEKIHHLDLQAKILRSINIRIICLVCDLGENRYDTVLQRLSKLKILFNHHLENVIVVITKCEKENEEDKLKLKYILGTQLKLSNIFCTDDTVEPCRLSHWIYSFVKEVKDIKAGEGVFESQALNTLINDFESDYRIIESRNNKEKIFKIIYEKTKEFYNGAEDSNLKRGLYFSLKQHLDKLTDDYAKELTPIVKDRWHLEAELIIFQKSLMNLFSQFKEIVMKDIKIDNVHYTTGGIEPGYRQCPCGVIWFRIYGCDSIICGRRSISKDFTNISFYNYNIVWTGTRLQVQKKEMVNKVVETFTDKQIVGLTPEEIKINEQRRLEKKILISPVGCGKEIEWSKMKIVTDDVILRLKDFNIDITSEVKKIASKRENDIVKIAGLDNNISNYTVNQLSDWLKQNGLENIVKKFADAKIDGSVLLNLSDADYKELEIPIGTKLKIRNFLK